MKRKNESETKLFLNERENRFYLDAIIFFLNLVLFTNKRINLSLIKEYSRFDMI